MIQLVLHAAQTDVYLYRGDVTAIATVLIIVMKGIALRAIGTALLCNLPVQTANVFKSDGAVMETMTVGTGVMRVGVVSLIIYSLSVMQP